MKPTSLIDSASGWPEPILGSDKLSHEIFSFLESRFLFGPDETLTLDCGGGGGGGGGRGRVRILSIDGGGGGGELAAAALARLEARLRELSGNPSARIVDFFDLAAGSGAGAVLAAALFTRGGLSAADAAAALALVQSDDHHRRRMRTRSWIFGRRSRGGMGALDGVFGEATMRDAAKPLLIPCYDAATGAPYVFSRADAVEGDAYDFLVRDVCAAAYGPPAAAAAAVSVDGATRVLPAASATAMASPAAAAVTHVLHNKQEFPFVAGVADLLLVSIGNGGGGSAASESAEELLRIAGAAQADMVDQALAFAFGESRSASYVRIQGDGVTAGRTAEATLAERSVESVLFRGRRMTETTNGERLDWAAGELAKEEERRRRSKTPTVLIKPAAAAVTPRTSSSASSEITVSTVSGASSASL